MNPHPEHMDRGLLDEALFIEDTPDEDPLSTLANHAIQAVPNPPRTMVRDGTNNYPLTHLAPGLYEVVSPNAHEPESFRPMSAEEELPSAVQVCFPTIPGESEKDDPETLPSYHWSEQAAEATAEVTEELLDTEPGVEDATEDLLDSSGTCVEIEVIADAEPILEVGEEIANAQPIPYLDTYENEGPIPSLEISGADLPSLELVANTGMTLSPGETVILTEQRLRLIGEDPFLLDIVLLSPPTQGVLLRDGFALASGDVFTQEDINHGRISYRHEGEPGDDEFVFCTPQEEIPATRFSIHIQTARLAPEVLTPGRLHNPVEGTRIADLLGEVKSYESELAPGMALIGTSGRGQWEYSIDGGASWQPVGFVQPDHALLLGSSQLLRFVPRPGWSGRVQLTFRAWDRSCGNVGSYIDLANPHDVGGASAFSVQQLQVSASIRPVLPAVVEPWISPAKVEELLGEAVAIIRADGPGIWQFSLDDGQSWQDFGVVFHGRARLLLGKNRVRFLPSKAAQGRVVLTGRPWDGSSHPNGSLVNLSGHKATGQGTPFGELAQSRTWRIHLD